MCGICGAFGVEVPLDKMGECQTHRGPEATGTYRDDKVSLANQRLKIIDVEGGDQPIYNEEGDVVVVYNGEIYNFQTLRTELQEAGHTFTTDTDTEVLVHGYEEWGTDLFRQLNGMVAAAIYDATKQRLLLVRDRAGIKPLHYALTPDGIVFASEPKAILKSGVVEPAVDTDALRYFLQLRYSPTGTTLFDGIETLLPGTYLDCQLGDGAVDLSTHQYWNLSMTPDNPPADPASALRSKLERAVERQLVSDVPVAFYLSGGLDTSSVVAMASKLRDEPIHTFCMGFADSEWDERSNARAVAEHFDTIHHETTIEGDFMQDFPRMIWHADEPKRNLYPYYVSQAMANHVTVALGGLGADELFGGYIYRVHRLGDLEEIRDSADWLRKHVMKNAETTKYHQLTSGSLDEDDMLEDLGTLNHLSDSARLYVLLNSTDVIGDIETFEWRVFGDRLQGGAIPADLIRERVDPAEIDSDWTDLREQALTWDFTVKLPNDFLHVEDRMSMAHSLESRVPFLDNELIDLAFSLSYEQKVGTNTRGSGTPTHGKKILREAMSDVLPKQVFERDKQGFTMPTYRFVETELLDYARPILDDSNIVREGLVQQSYIDDVLDRGLDRALVPHYKVLWKLVALEIWYQMYFVGSLDGPAPIDAYL